MNNSDEEMNICETCGHITDSCDDYGNDDHSTEVKFSPLSEEVVKQLLWFRSAKKFEELRRRSANAKCAFIKETTRDIANLERKVRLIRAILDGQINVVGNSYTEVQRQMSQLGLDKGYPRVFLELDVSDLCEEQLTHFTQVIAERRNDIEAIKRVESVKV